MDSLKGKQITGIGMQVLIKGRGVVNFDGPSGKFHAPVKSSNDNIKCAKTAISFQCDEDGEVLVDENGRPKVKYRQAKISSHCLRNALFKREHPGQSSSILAGLKSESLISLVASYSGVVRGYLYAIKNSNIKRKSPLMITDAIQTNSQLLKIETCTSSGARSDTSLFEQDNIGDTTYECKAYLDLSEMAFIPCDTAIDRPAFNEDQYDLYKECMERKYGTTLPKEPTYYTKETAEIPISERGFILPKDLVWEFATRLIESLQNCSIQRANAFANVNKVHLYFKTTDDLSFEFDEDPALVIHRKSNVKGELENIVKNNSISCQYRPSGESEIELTRSYLERLAEEKASKNEEKQTKKKKTKKKTEAKSKAKAKK